MRKRKETARDLAWEELPLLRGESEKQKLGQLITQARLDAGLQNHKALADLIPSQHNPGKTVHLNTISAWEQGKMDARRYIPAIEKATGKPPGWFRLQLDPIGHVIQLADEVAEIKRLVEKIALKVL